MIKNKITNKIKKIPLLMLGIILTIKSTIYAVAGGSDYISSGETGRITSLTPDKLTIFKRFLFDPILLLILIISTIVYWKHSKKSKLTKVWMIIALVIVTIYFQTFLWMVIFDFSHGPILPPS